MPDFPWDFVEFCSIESLSSFALAERDAAARHRKAMRGELDKMVAALVNAEVAEAILQNADRLRNTIELRQQSFKFEKSLMRSPSLPSKKEIETVRKLSS